VSAAAAGAPAARYEAANPWTVTAVVMLGMIMSIIDASIVNVAVPHMMGSLGASISEVSWVVTSYALANVVIIPLAAWVNSVVGRARMYFLSVILFTVASVVCGLATGLGVLVAARFAQGMAAGIMMPTGQAILYESFPPHERGTSMAIFGLGIMVGPAIGPTLGGWITDNHGWPWIFFINLPIGIVAAILVPIFLKDPPYLRRRASARGDLIGVLLLASGVGLFQLLVDQGEDLGWFHSDPFVLGAVASVLLLVGFVAWELDHPDPAVDLHVFRDRNFATASAVNVAVGVGLMGGLFMLPLFLQQMLGFNAMQSGLILVPGAIATAVAMPICGRLSDRMDPRILTVSGLLVFAASMAMMSRLDASAGARDLLLPQILRGFGMAFCFVPLSVTAMARMSQARMGQASGLFNLTRQIGGSVGVAWLASRLSALRAQHTADLAAGLDAFDPDVQAALQGTTAAMSARGAPLDQAREMALRFLDFRVLGGAAELAFRDIFLTIVVLFVLSAPLLLFLRRTARGGTVAVVHGE
jgi:DHA2 family multidrug resistance protein